MGVGNRKPSRRSSWRRTLACLSTPASCRSSYRNRVPSKTLLPTRPQQTTPRRERKMATTLAHNGLCREATFEVRDAETVDGGDGLTLSGYAAVFGQGTEIDSWEGTFTEEIRQGAFRKTIRERQPVMQFDHGRHPLIGSIPIASIRDLREEPEGLWVEARMTDNWLIEPVRMAI